MGRELRYVLENISLDQILTAYSSLVVSIGHMVASIKFLRPGGERFICTFSHPTCSPALRTSTDSILSERNRVGSLVGDRGPHRCLQHQPTQLLLVLQAGPRSWSSVRLHVARLHHQVAPTVSHFADRPGWALILGQIGPPESH